MSATCVEQIRRVLRFFISAQTGMASLTAKPFFSSLIVAVTVPDTQHQEPIASNVSFSTGNCKIGQVQTYSPPTDFNWKETKEMEIELRHCLMTEGLNLKLALNLNMNFLKLIL